MPAEDRYHQKVVRALIKDGWTIRGEQVYYGVPDRSLWIDISAAKADQDLIILVEVKGFENMASPVEYMALAVGKYILYQVAIEYYRLNAPLFLAVPNEAYNGVLSEELGQLVLQKAHISLMVFEPETEEIVLWKP